MNSVLLQDLFSNVLLAMLALLLVSIRLVGEPEPEPVLGTICQTEGTSNKAWFVLATELTVDDKRGAIVLAVDWNSRQTTTLPKQPVKSLLAFLNGGCLRTCFKCPAQVAPLIVPGANGPTVQQCTAVSC